MGGEDNDPFAGRAPKDKKAREKWKQKLHDDKPFEGRGPRDNIDPKTFEPPQ
jgi:hypothetical protein